MLLVLLEEEYGYRNWIWRYPHSKQQLLADWKAGKAPLNSFNPSHSVFDGILTQFTWPRRGEPPIILSEIPYVEVSNFKEALDACDAQAHVHDKDDTELVLDDVRYPGVPDFTETKL